MHRLSNLVCFKLSQYSQNNCSSYLIYSKLEVKYHKVPYYLKPKAKLKTFSQISNYAELVNQSLDPWLQMFDQFLDLRMIFDWILEFCIYVDSPYFSIFFDFLDIFHFEALNRKFISPNPLSFHWHHSILFPSLSFSIQLS